MPHLLAPIAVCGKVVVVNAHDANIPLCDIVFAVDIKDHDFLFIFHGTIK